MTQVTTTTALLARRHLRARNPGICASAERGAARGDQVELPLRLHRALLQRPAGRRGFAGVPAEEHVEPVGVLRRRGARRGSAGRGSRRPNRRAEKAKNPRLSQRPSRKPKPSSCRQGGQAAAEPKAASAAKKPSQAQISAIRSALPRRLSEGVRRRADRRRSRRWNAWRRTRPRSRRPAPRRLRPSAAVAPAAHGCRRHQRRRCARGSSGSGRA